MDALVRHKKAEHGECLDKQPTTPILTSHTPLMPIISTTNKPRKNTTKKTSLDMLSKNKRMNTEWTGPSSGEESDDSEIKPSTQSLLSGSPDYTQYRLAKAQLSYILRENEMIQDEFDIAQKKLKRMRTERRVLLDAVMASETQQDEYEIIPNEHETA